VAVEGGRATGAALTTMSRRAPVPVIASTIARVPRSAIGGPPWAARSGLTRELEEEESGCVGYGCSGRWGGLEISATIAPTDLSFASSAISAWDTTPTSRFSSSTTGSRRT
jgi:hypothetical protein